MSFCTVVYVCSKRGTRNSALKVFFAVVRLLRDFFRLLLLLLLLLVPLETVPRTVNSIVALHPHPLSARLHSTANLLVLSARAKAKQSIRLEVHIVIVVDAQCFLLLKIITVLSLKTNFILVSQL